MMLVVDLKRRTISSKGAHDPIQAWEALERETMSYGSSPLIRDPLRRTRAVLTRLSSVEARVGQRPLATSPWKESVSFSSKKRRGHVTKSAVTPSVENRSAMSKPWA